MAPPGEDLEWVTTNKSTKSKHVWPARVKTAHTCNKKNDLGINTTSKRVESRCLCKFPRVLCFHVIMKSYGRILFQARSFLQSSSIMMISRVLSSLNNRPPFPCYEAVDLIRPIWLDQIFYPCLFGGIFWFESRGIVGYLQLDWVL